MSEFDSALDIDATVDSSKTGVDPIKKAFNQEGISFASVEELKNSVIQKSSRNNEMSEAKNLIERLCSQFSALKQRIAEVDEQQAFSELDSTFRHIQSIRFLLNTERQSELKLFFQKKILPFTLESTFCKHVYEKPKGYAGDYIAMELIWQGAFLGDNFRYMGSSDLGKLLNAYALDSANCKANIERVFRLSKLVTTISNGVIASIGCGSSIELEVALRTRPMPKLIIHLFDQDEEALQISYTRLSRLTNKRNIILHNGNILKSIYRDHETRYDFVYSSGMFDYFSLNSTQRLVKMLWSTLASNAQLLITNAHPQNPTRTFMEFGGEWYLEYKDMNQMKSILSDSPALKELSVIKDWNNVYQYMSFYKQ